MPLSLSYVDILTPRIPKCDYLEESGFLKEVIDAKMSSYLWALIQIWLPMKGGVQGTNAQREDPVRTQGKCSHLLAEARGYRRDNLILLGLQAHGAKKICFCGLSSPVCGRWSWQLLQTGTCLWEKYVFCRQKLLGEWVYSKPWVQSGDYKNKAFSVSYMVRLPFWLRIRKICIKKHIGLERHLSR